MSVSPRSFALLERERREILSVTEGSKKRSKRTTRTRKHVFFSFQAVHSHPLATYSYSIFPVFSCAPSSRLIERIAWCLTRQRQAFFFSSFCLNHIDLSRSPVCLPTSYFSDQLIPVTNCLTDSSARTIRCIHSRRNP